MKNDLIDKIIRRPLSFTNEDFTTLISSYVSNGIYDVESAFRDFRNCLKRILNLNESNLLESSSATVGQIGELNKEYHEKRLKIFNQKINDQLSSNENSKRKILIYSEGDSWFMFPKYVEDIVDWLIKEDDFIVYSDAYAGDWISNIIYEGKYIHDLSLLLPDVFLIGGGGNDLVANNRLALMVNGPHNRKNVPLKYNVDQISHLSEIEKKSILSVQNYIALEFYSLILILKAQYTMLFNGLYKNTDKFKKMISLTHGYAYPFPKKGPNFSFDNPLQYIVNWRIESGKWLFTPLLIRGIADTKIQRSIVTFFIYEFNEMLKNVSEQFENVHYVDLRDIPKKQEDWYDEMHLKSHKYEEAAKRIGDIVRRLFKPSENMIS